MRTTLTLDEDVVFGLEKIKERDRDKSFKQIVNEVLRNGLKNGTRASKKKFKVKAYNLGLREGLNLDNIEELLDQIEGPNRK